MAAGGVRRAQVELAGCAVVGLVSSLLFVGSAEAQSVITVVGSPAVFDRQAAKKKLGKKSARQQNSKNEQRSQRLKRRKRDLRRRKFEENEERDEEKGYHAAPGVTSGKPFAANGTVVHLPGSQR